LYNRQNVVINILESTNIRGNLNFSVRVNEYFKYVTVSYNCVFVVVPYVYTVNIKFKH